MNAVGMAPAPTSPRPRSRGFSFRSDRSGGSKTKDVIVESPQEKQRRDTLWKSSKANPNAALTESQPAFANLLEDTTIQSLRGVQHKDAAGNVITDPDLSNPTRPRLERPLDTIRSFERAIDHGYRRRTSYNRSESYTHENSGSRRNSYYGNGNENGPGPNGGNNNRQSQGGGYYGAPQQRDSYGPNGSTPRVMRQGPGPRQSSDVGGYYNNGPAGGRQHPHAHQPSQDTMHTAGSSDSSSVERFSHHDSNGGPQPPSVPAHGGPGYGNSSSSAANGFNGGIPEEGGAYPFPGGKGQAARPIPLGNSVSAGTTNLPPSNRPEPEKRRSWLQRRFSKKE